jgi:hypothetical protein
MKIRFVVACVLFSACTSSEVLLNTLVVKDGKYHYNDKPFSGHAISKFANGSISNDINFENGIPKGNWRAYGYQKEIVQSGEYLPLPAYNDEVSNTVLRINVCTTKEGDFTYRTVFVVTNNPQLDSAKTHSKLSEWFKIHPVDGVDSATTRKYVIGELE